MPSYIGSYWFLYEVPIWALALIFYAITLGVIFVGRHYLEGLPYQVSYSAQFGDAMLIGGVLIAATILQRGGVALPDWLMSARIQAIIGLACVGLGIIICASTLQSRSGQFMDIYHDVVIGPMILYLAITLIPVIWLGGTKVEKIATICFVIFWAVLVVFDIKHERMDQRSWLEKHGVTLKL